MGTASLPISNESIQRVTQQIVERFHPRKVILFGSYAYGQPTADSDVDLLVVIDTEEPPLHVAAQIAAEIEHTFPLDIVVRTPVELQVAAQRKGVFVSEVMSKGIVLYETRDTGMDLLKPRLARLSAFGIAARYPGGRVDQKAATEALQTAEEVQTVMRVKLGLL